MTDDTPDHLSIDAVLDRIETGDWRLIGLPTMSGKGLYLVYHDGHFDWFSIDGLKGRSASRYRSMNRDAARAFLSEYQRHEDGYEATLLEPWGEDDGQTPASLTAALTQAEANADALRAKPCERFARVMDTWWMWSSPWFGWVARTLREDGSPYRFTLDDRRALSELLAMQLREPGLALETPPREDAAAIEAFTAEVRARFEAHGPTTERILWAEEAGGPKRRGYLRDSRGFFVRVIFDDAERLHTYEKMPTDTAHEALLDDFEGGALAHGSEAVDAALAEQLEALQSVPSVARLLAERSVTIGCGEHRSSQWVADSPETLLDVYGSTSHPLREALPRFLEEEAWYRVRYEALPDLSEVARAEDDPEDPFTLRYTIPVAWARRFSRNDLIDAACLAIVQAATGADTSGWSHETHEEPAERYSAPDLTTRWRDPASEVQLTLHRSPIESGHGVHGEHVSARFTELPEGLRVEVRARLSMVSGGHVHVDITGEDDELAARIKAACLETLP